MDRQTRPRSRSWLAAQFDALTLAALAVLLSLMVGAVLKMGPEEALARIGCGLNGAVDGFLPHPQPCR